MPSWAELNERQQYMQAINETDQEQEADERGAWKRGGTDIFWTFYLNVLEE